MYFSKLFFKSDEQEFSLRGVEELKDLRLSKKRSAEENPEGE